MKKQQPDLNRRSLLKAITVGSAATAAIAVSGVSVAKATESNISIKGSNGYKETAHIRSYYDSLRG
ncbi:MULTISPECIES: twin-arginine translocation signal domain-containing protein [unclassified Shewanella]|uniref:twin-arginine translocation signal domain-containing protein n=1 Tax=unclassified Shewanella TaxID=196818 RepID=UPI000C84ADAC|nr:MULTISPECIES: twin-arginine translocation signal domain-containing protein [unclassified Shewanella]MDO6619654.1 twin-arginine translocation signal domain-containing protein [Shewanella sp. 6_MG-2023]MDO6640609.1 twin-arginine translocation signal domain-containing protein [Shewanella sp. 5_MG-2023]MDO6678742.1 twin-arginine translocation signal domain-containing protein [Shewanella sp. 4_MG-2023]MDO6775758.1 twin-arginine translocation signal domain-containing protein [Shewanella sp. 3_MG-2